MCCNLYICHVYCELMAKSVITHDQDSTMTFVISLSSPSITPCPEATSLTVLSVNDEVNERMNTIMEEEEEDISTMFLSSVNASYHGNSIEEEKEE